MFQEGGSVSFHELEPALADAVSARAPKRGKSRAEFILNESTSSTIAITERGRKALEDSRGRVTIGRVTREILASGEWKKGTFRRYQVDIPPARIHIGRLHPYGVFLSTVRNKLQSMGFREMKGHLRRTSSGTTMPFSCPSSTPPGTSTTPTIWRRA